MIKFVLEKVKFCIYLKDVTIYILERNSNHGVDAFNITDDKISLVNDDTQVKPVRNHFERKVLEDKRGLPIINKGVDNNPQMTFKTQDHRETHNKAFDDVLYQKNEQLSKSNEALERKNFELEEKLVERGNEAQRINGVIEQLTEDYGKLTAKHNALLIYASDLQKKIDLYQIELVEKRDEILTAKQSDWGKVIQEKDKLFKIIENEMNFYKQELNSVKSKHPTGFSNNNNLRVDFGIDNHLLENYLQENKKLKRLV
jgi:hypothetical protein